MDKIIERKIIINTIIFILFGLFLLLIIIFAIIFTKRDFKELDKAVQKMSNRLELRDTLKEHSFSIVDILLIYEKDLKTFILIKDNEDKTTYMYESWIDEYQWFGNEEYYIEPYFFPGKNEEICMVENKDYNNYPLVFNQTGGKYKLVEEIGHFEIHDDILYTYYSDGSTYSNKIKNIKHANKAYDINLIHNVILIDCFIKYEVE